MQLKQSAKTRFGRDCKEGRSGSIVDLPGCVYCICKYQKYKSVELGDYSRSIVELPDCRSDRVMLAHQKTRPACYNCACPHFWPRLGSTLLNPFCIIWILTVSPALGETSWIVKSAAWEEFKGAEGGTYLDQGGGKNEADRWIWNGNMQQVCSKKDIFCWATI